MERLSQSATLSDSIVSDHRKLVGPLGLELAGNHTLFIRISQWLNGAYPGWYPKVDHASRAAYNLHEIRCEVHCYTVR